VQSFFEAIRPAQLDVLDAMLTYQQQEQAGLEQQWQQRLKRAEYEVHLAQRQYDAVDPDNRLVAGELERRWEEKLVQLYNTREAYTHFQQKLVPTRLTPELRGQFQQLSQHLPELWAGGTLSNEHKKELLRNLIEKVILTREKPDTITIKIVWVSGHYSLAEAYPPLGQDSDIEGYEVMIEQIGKLWQQGLNDEQIATQLTAAGFRSAQRLKVLPTCVQRHRLANGWYHPLHQTRGATEFEGRWTCRGLAEKLGVSQSWVKRRIQGGQIPGKHVTYYSQIRRYLIDKDPELMTQLRQLASKSRKRKPTDQDSDR